MTSLFCGRWRILSRGPLGLRVVGGGGQWTARRLFFVVATTTIIFTTICYEGHSTIILGMTTIVSLCVVEPKKYRHRHWHQRQQQDQTICQIRWKKPFLTKNESFASLRRFFLECNETIIFKENRKNPFEPLETFLPSFRGSLFRFLCLVPRTSLERLLGTIEQNFHQPFLKVLFGPLRQERGYKGAASPC